MWRKIGIENGIGKLCVEETDCLLGMAGFNALPRSKLDGTSLAAIRKAKTGVTDLKKVYKVLKTPQCRMLLKRIEKLVSNAKSNILPNDIPPPKQRVSGSVSEPASPPKPRVSGSVSEPASSNSINPDPVIVARTVSMPASRVSEVRFRTYFAAILICGCNSWY